MPNATPGQVMSDDELFLKKIDELTEYAEAQRDDMTPMGYVLNYAVCIMEKADRTFLVTEAQRIRSHLTQKLYAEILKKTDRVTTMDALKKEYPRIFRD